MMAAGAEAIVLAGTDLNLAFDRVDAGYPVIGALDVHVGVLAKRADQQMAAAMQRYPAAIYSQASAVMTAPGLDERRFPSSSQLIDSQQWHLAMSKTEVQPPPPAKRVLVSQSDFPNIPLSQAIRIAKAIWDNFAGKGSAPHNIAMSIDVSPTSSSWRIMCGSSISYGLTEGGYNASQIILTELGRRIVAPIEDGDDVAAKVEAVLKPRIQRDFFLRYDKAKLPRDDIGQNVLISLGIPKERASAAYAILKENGTAVGIVRETKTGPFVAVEVRSKSSVTPERNGFAEEPDAGAVAAADREDHSPEVVSTLPISSKPKQLFVAHGKKHKPLEDLKKILNEFKIPYKVAIDEANKGRPISGKVAELMNECSAGIFIFTKDEKFQKENKDGDLEEVWRPSENVVYELGAANILWDRKIIIVREDGVNFPSDFSDLGYITFKDGEIANRALDILKELIALQLVTVTAS